MHKVKYTKLDADGDALPDDAEGHLAVLVEHPMLAKPLTVSAYRVLKDRDDWKSVMAACEKHDAYGWSWRAPTVEEAFFLPDRTQFPSLPKLYFPDALDFETIWTSTPYAPVPGRAWVVNLVDGSADAGVQSVRYHVRAVRAGQP